MSTRFHAPVPSHVLISRPHLILLLNQSFHHPLILISAPAGFGKTTLASVWVHSLPNDQIQVAWISLDREDNDPVQFWITILTALEEGTHSSFHQLLELLHARPAPPLEHILTLLANRFGDTTRPWLLLLDDYQVISDSSIHNQLSYLLEHQPPNVHLLLLSRNEPPLSLARLRANGLLLEVREEQLRATVEETRVFLTEVTSMRPPDEVIEELAWHIEGWWVGLRLLGFLLQRCTDPTGMVTEIRGGQRDIMDYLVEEVLRQQSAPMQRFLLRTSILEQLCSPLCNAVTGEPDAQQKLVALERANIFVKPLDEHRQWYRYHTFFAEALRSQLALQHADEIDVLHVRACSWYAEQGNTFEAIRHALLAHAWQLAADLIEQVPHWFMWNEGENHAGQLRQWLNQLPAVVLRTHPQLCLIYAQALHFVAPHATTEYWLQAAEMGLLTSLAQTDKTSASCKTQENLLGEIATFRAVQAIYQFGDAQTGLALCQQARTLFSPENLPLQSEALLVQAIAHFANGEMKGAYRSALQAEQLAQEAHLIPGAVFSLSIAGRCLIVAGHLYEAWEMLERAVHLANMREEGPLPRMDLIYALQAEILQEWNRLDEALALITQAIELAEQLGTSATSIVIYTMLARVALSRGQLEVARSALKHIEALKKGSNNPLLYSFHTAVTQMQFWLVERDLTHATTWAEALLEHKRSCAAIVREREEMALVHLLVAQDRPKEALTCLIPLLEHAEQQERWSHVLELLLLQTKTYELLGEEREALILLSYAVQMAEPEGYVRLFADEGSLFTLLRCLWEREHKLGPTPYLDTLLAAFSTCEQAEQLPTQSRRPETLTQLSNREMEVLQSLSHGASNQEIAENLVITIETVKRHLGKIFRKLQVHNRTQAVVRSRMLGLLTKETF
ncbi:HTH-type transcriptional regulator MalT [Reticulibacter mediterranei]|uniref:HTH-type transcriptional regulator MalT n=1 Tax=Reticulibacter mediterranei TaxID=2778369 RepID=A0A8J3N0W1_9CHLR|nr:HTH-type transcriptional regulator MalT [Reticulibacter mediterranei]